MLGNEDRKRIMRSEDNSLILAAGVKRFREWKVATMVNMPAVKMQESREVAAAVADEVRATLARQNMLMRDLSKKSGISPGYLGKRLRNEAPLNLNDVEAICAVFERDVLSFIQAALEAAGYKSGGAK